MNQEFLKPKLVGRRFDEHTLPLEVLRDFAALEEMIIEVAKREYLAVHPKRLRTPKGFTKQLELHLSAVEPGSAIPVIVLAFAGLFPDADYFDRAKDKIVETIASAEMQQAPSLPPELLRYFDRFGRSLREGEAIEFARSNGQSATLTPQLRERLLRASQAEEWTEEVTLKGRIPEVDQSDLTFEVELRDGTKLRAPLAEHLRSTVLEASVGYRDNLLVSVQGIVKRDRADRLKSFETVEHITTLDPLDIETRLEELSELKDGWLNGKGKAPDSDALRALTHKFERFFDTELPLPYIYPTPDGGIQAEWTIGGTEISLEIELPSQQAFYQALNIHTGKEEDLELRLADGEQWKQLNAALKAVQGVNA